MKNVIKKEEKNKKTTKYYSKKKKKTTKQESFKNTIKRRAYEHQLSLAIEHQAPWL